MGHVREARDNDTLISCKKLCTSSCFHNFLCWPNTESLYIQHAFLESVPLNHGYDDHIPLERRIQTCHIFQCISLNLFVTIWHYVHGTPMGHLVHITNRMFKDFSLIGWLYANSEGYYQIGLYQWKHLRSHWTSCWICKFTNYTGEFSLKQMARINCKLQQPVGSKVWCRETNGKYTVSLTYSL